MSDFTPLPSDIASDLVSYGLPEDSFDPIISVKYNSVNYNIDVRDLEILNNLRYQEPTCRLTSGDRAEPLNLAANPLYIRAKDTDSDKYVVLMIQHRIATIVFDKYVQKQFEYVKCYNKLVSSANYSYGCGEEEYKKYYKSLYNIAKYQNNKNRIKLK